MSAPTLLVGRLILVDSVKTAKWVSECFIYTTVSSHINYFVGSESYTISPSNTYVSRLSCTILSISDSPDHYTSSAMSQHITASTSPTKTCPSLPTHSR